jgi:SAM-dependent methyltransferase
MAFVEFVLARLPAGGRVLEMGCGDGELALVLADRGYDVLAIDPVAPDGPIFRRVALEELDDPGPFAAVVASRSLHHVGDLGAALDKIAALLAPGGVLLLDEFAPDRLDDPTTDWWYGQRRALAAARGKGAPASLDAFRAEQAREHEGLHGYATIRPALDARFEERAFSWEPYLYRELDGVATRELERALIDAGAIQATGYRYAGVPLATIRPHTRSEEP